MVATDPFSQWTNDSHLVQECLCQFQSLTRTSRRQTIIYQIVALIAQVISTWSAYARLGEDIERWFTPSETLSIVMHLSTIEWKYWLPCLHRIQGWEGLNLWTTKGHIQWSLDGVWVHHSLLEMGVVHIGGHAQWSMGNMRTCLQCASDYKK